jgi:hypothetical protein
LIKLEKWVCKSTVKFEEECDTVFYVEGEYNFPPNCPECGRDSLVKCLGTKNYLEVSGNDN